jgi:hypothetical protein
MSLPHDTFWIGKVARHSPAFMVVAVNVGPSNQSFPTPSYFEESNFLRRDHCTVKQHQRYCKRQS